MVKAKVAINGYGTIGKRVADAVKAQDDLEIVGVSKTKSNYQSTVAYQLGFDIYAPTTSFTSFGSRNTYSIFTKLMQNTSFSNFVSFVVSPPTLKKILTEK